MDYDIHQNMAEVDGWERTFGLVELEASDAGGKKEQAWPWR
jgi:hypothetical protein